MTTKMETAADADDAGSAGSRGADVEPPPQPAGAAGRRAVTPAPARPTLDLDVIVARTSGGDNVARVDTNRLREGLDAALGHLGRPVARVAVLVVDDASMATLHARHAGVDGPTDVLTFANAAAGAPLDADIAINADEAAREAAARGHDAADELLLYALHGVLHCAGFDDHASAEYDAMHAEEDRILGEIGVGATFGREGRSGGGEREASR